MTTRPPAGDPPLADVFWAAAEVHAARSRLQRSLRVLHDSPFDEAAREAVLRELSDPAPLAAARRLERTPVSAPLGSAGPPAATSPPRRRR